MAGRLRKTFVLAASLVLAGAAISETSAWAQYGGQDCWTQVQSGCVTQWQAWGYYSVEACAAEEPCRYCPRDGHDCFEIDWFDSNEM